VQWLNDNAGAVQALATIVLIGVTTAYVMLTRSISRSTQKQAEATHQEVEATRQEVETTRQLVDARREQVEISRTLVESAVTQANATQALAEESRRGRSLTYLPVVAAQFAGSTGNRIKIQVTNHGSGAALAVRVQWFARAPAIVASSELIDVAAFLSAGESITRETVVNDAEGQRVLTQSAGHGFTHNCQYLNINGAEYQTQIRGNEFDLVPLNDAAKFALGREE
jgi:hypothetical protein